MLEHLRVELLLGVVGLGVDPASAQGTAQMGETKISCINTINSSKLNACHKDKLCSKYILPRF